jgi:predicted nucleic acid-binding protein
MHAVDSNVLVRLVVGDNPSQTASAEEFIEHGGWVSLLALAETIWVLKAVYGRGAGDLAATVEMLLDHGSLVFQDSETVASALRLFRLRPSLGFSDCLMLELARRAGHLPLGTFDRKLGRVGGAQKL